MSAGRRTPDSPWTLLALLLGSLVPCLLAVALIALAQRGDQDAPTPTPAPAEETLRAPFGGGEVRTQVEYQGTVRLFFEGSSAGRDAFYTFSGETDETAAQLGTLLEIDGRPALDALGWLAEPPAYAPDHLYAVRYDVGPAPRRLTFRVGGVATGATLTITVVPLR